MSSQHLSDEAVAAFADGVLSGHARERAARHAAGCPECAYAVAVQREAVWALRAAPAPSLPIGLMERLRSVPSTTPITNVPSAVSRDGSALFSAFGPLAAAALVPAKPEPTHRSMFSHRVRPIVLTAAAVAAAGVLAVGSGVTAAASRQPDPASPAAPQLVQAPGQVATFVQAPGGAADLLPAGAVAQHVMPANADLRIGR